MFIEHFSVSNRRNEAIHNSQFLLNQSQCKTQSCTNYWLVFQEQSPSIYFTTASWWKISYLMWNIGMCSECFVDLEFEHVHTNTWKNNNRIHNIGISQSTKAKIFYLYSKDRWSRCRHYMVSNNLFWPCVKLSSYLAPYLNYFSEGFECSFCLLFWWNVHLHFYP